MTPEVDLCPPHVCAHTCTLTHMYKHTYAYKIHTLIFYLKMTVSPGLMWWEYLCKLWKHKGWRLMEHSQQSLLGREQNGSRVQFPPSLFTETINLLHNTRWAGSERWASIPSLSYSFANGFWVYCVYQHFPQIPGWLRWAGDVVPPSGRCILGREREKTSKLTHTQHLRCGEMLQKKIKPGDSCVKTWRETFQLLGHKSRILKEPLMFTTEKGQQET